MKVYGVMAINGDHVSKLEFTPALYADEARAIERAEQEAKRDGSEPMGEWMPLAGFSGNAKRRTYQDWNAITQSWMMWTWVVIEMTVE